MRSSSSPTSRASLLATLLAITVAGLLTACGSSSSDGSSASPSASSASSASSTASPSSSSSIVGTWAADASEILGANTANVGGAGALSCTGRILMKFTAEGQFTRGGRVTCSAAGRSQSGAVASAGTYTTSGDTLTIGGYRSTGSIPDSFGSASATYSISGDTLTITFNGGSAGTITQRYQRA